MSVEQEQGTKIILVSHALAPNVRYWIEVDAEKNPVVGPDGVAIRASRNAAFESYDRPYHRCQPAGTFPAGSFSPSYWPCTPRYAPNEEAA